jgi:hypothetical protein
VNLGLLQRDLPNPIQGIKTAIVSLVPSATGPVTAFQTVIPSAVGGAASWATAAISSVIGDAVESINHKLPTSYSIGTKNICVGLGGQPSCTPIPSLEVVYVFGLSLILVSLASFILKFFLPFMGVLTLVLSVLGLVFFIVFAACVLLIGEIVSGLARSTIIQVEKGNLVPDSIGTLVCGIAWAIIGVIDVAL